jgi:hypothetical protein
MAIESVFSRRGLVVGMAGAAVAGTVAVQKSGGAEAFARLLRPHGQGRPGAWLAKATSDDWALQIGSTFTAHSGHVLKLIDVQRFPQKGTRPKGLRDRAFVARFDVVKGGKMPGNTVYRVNHKRGPFNLFLDAENPTRVRRMTAVFN